MNKLVKRYFPIFSIALLVLLVAVFVLRIVYNKPYFVTSVIANDLAQITNALDQIDRECNILSTGSNKVNIDFLTVQKFIGSEVGGLNLVYSDQWKGPYLKDDPTLYGIFYQILKTKEGYFVVPGEGAKLPNGLTVGTDFKIDTDSSVIKMMAEGGQLNYKGRPLACELKFKVGDWQKRPFNKKQIKEVSSALKEFNEAMPFTCNYSTGGQLYA